MNSNAEEKVRAYLAQRGYEERITRHGGTIDTVAHAAEQIGCGEGEIVKTLSFGVRRDPVVVAVAGDRRISSAKFKAAFGQKPYMLPPGEVERVTGFQPGGVCPFALTEGLPVYLDISLRAHRTVHPAAGSEFSSASFTPEELYIVSGALGWCDVCT